MSDKIQKVSVIGAGHAGSTEAKQMLSEPEVGERGRIERETQLALQINVPKELQEFPSFPYPKEWTTLYITRQQCFEYLNMFMDNFDLRKYIRTARGYFIYMETSSESDGRLQIFGCAPI